MKMRILRKAVALSLACQLSLHAQSLSMIAQEMRAQQSVLRKLVTPTRIFSRPKSNISSLIGLDQIPNIEYAWIVNLPGNKIDTLPAGFFKNPKFKNVRWLNLSHNKFRNIEQDGLEGLENLWVLLLDYNQLRSLKPGTLKALKSLKVLTLTGNPRDGALGEQARKELPGTLVINKKMTKNFMLWTLKIVGVAAALTTLGFVIASRATGPSAPDALYDAIEKGSVINVSEQLNMAGANPNKRYTDRLETPLMIAAKNGRDDIVDLLLAHHADISLKNAGGQTAYELVPTLVPANREEERLKLRYNHIRELIGQRQQPITSLEEAVRLGRLDQVKKIIEADSPQGKIFTEADFPLPEIKDKQFGEKKLTPLMIAIETDNFAIANWLLDHGADVTITNADNKTALDMAMADEKEIHSGEQDYDAVLEKINYRLTQPKAHKEAYGRRKEEFLERREQERLAREQRNVPPPLLAADQNVLDKRLFDAVKEGNISKVTEHLNDHANIDAKDDNAHTPLYFAVASNNEEMVAFLLGKRAKVDSEVLGVAQSKGMRERIMNAMYIAAVPK